MATVALEHVSVRHDAVLLLDDVNLVVGDGEMIGVVGASGAGKTTLLRAIAGVEALASGAISIGGVDVSDAAPAERNVSMVFQTPQLIPHRDVRRNIAFPLELRHHPEDDIATRVAAETRALPIEALPARPPRDLSAGEAQLVQIARALVHVPSVLLLDEPLARLDAPLSQHMRRDLRSLQQGYGVTTFLATNDPVEAMSLADRLVVLDGGHVVQVGAPMEIYERPATLMAAACTGRLSTVSALVERDGDGFWLVHPSFRQRAWRPSLAEHVGAAVLVVMRPTWLRVAADGPVHGTIAAASTVTGTITVALGNGPGLDEVEVATGGRVYRRGEEVSLRIEEVILFEPRTGGRLA